MGLAKDIKNDCMRMRAAMDKMPPPYGASFGTKGTLRTIIGGKGDGKVLGQLHGLPL